jgi:hypothetical protein
MPRTRWEPFAELWREMENFRREMDRLFERWGFEPYGWPELGLGYPAVNIWEG